MRWTWFGSPSCSISSSLSSSWSYSYSYSFFILGPSTTTFSHGRAGRYPIPQAASSPRQPMCQSRRYVPRIDRGCLGERFAHFVYSKTRSSAKGPWRRSLPSRSNLLVLLALWESAFFLPVPADGLSQTQRALAVRTNFRTRRSEFSRASTKIDRELGYLRSPRLVMTVR